MTKNEINYIKGDALHPNQEGSGVLAHCCNDLGVMGAGIALAIAKKWPIVKSRYVQWYRDRAGIKPFNVGQTQFVQVEENLVVANMIGQHDIRAKDGRAPVRYGAIQMCLEDVRNYIQDNKIDYFCCPYLMASDRAGGEWEEIEKLIQQEIVDHDIPVYVYDKYGKRDKDK